VFHHKIAHTGGIGPGHKLMPVAPGRSMQKTTLRRVTDPAAIGKQGTHDTVLYNIAFGINDLLNFGYGVLITMHGTNLLILSNNRRIFNEF
jgi:hypothetical protein